MGADSRTASRMRALVAGCGYVGSELARQLRGQGHQVWGLRRSPGGLPEGVDSFAADLSRPETLVGLPPGLDVVVYAAGADGFSQKAYEAAYVVGPANLLEALRAQGQRPRRFILVSSTGVYGQSDGSWVNEDSATEPSGFSGRILLAGEQTVLRGPWPVTVVRLGGIYGPGRTIFLERLRAGEASCVESPPEFTNLIHRDDCAAVLAHIATLVEPSSHYLAVDCEPAERCTLLRWLADRIGASPPAVVDASERARRRGNKRCSNRRLLDSGYRFKFPSYREGFASLLAS